MTHRCRDSMWIFFVFFVWIEFVETLIPPHQAPSYDHLNDCIKRAHVGFRNLWRQFSNSCCVSSPLSRFSRLMQNKKTAYSYIAHRMLTITTRLVLGDVIKLWQNAPPTCRSIAQNRAQTRLGVFREVAELLRARSALWRHGHARTILQQQQRRYW